MARMPCKRRMRARQALVAWAVHFPAGADALAAGFRARLAHSSTGSTAWALSQAFQVSF